MRGAREAALAALAGLTLVVAAPAERGQGPSAGADRDATRAADPGRQARPVRDGDGATTGRPARVTIPAIGVDARIVRLGLLPDGRLAPPADPDTVGWWARGPRPGRPGAAVLAGHLDSRSGPAVFARLAALRPDDEIRVHDASGRFVVFRVDAREWHPKDRFPTHRVYVRGARPLLRLVTCGGVFDPARRHYRANLIVFARPA